jgi:serine/threonine protein kinase/Flp pilus assembly protein CpaB
MIDSDQDRDLRTAQLLDEALDAFRSGRQPDRSQMLDRYPDLSADGPALIDTLANLHSAALDWTIDLRAGSTDDPLPETIGRYRIIERLGAGGMGTVYKAQDTQLERLVALKVPRWPNLRHDRASISQRFQREGKAAAQIHHPNVCPLYDVGEHEGMPYVVMAYVEGESLADRLRRDVRIESVQQAVAWIRDVAVGLAAVHAHGIIHRDLKPGNILIDLQSRAVLTDFGLARPENDTEHLTDEGTVLGTPTYMAPEQAAGETDRIVAQTDIYSLGVVFYQALTGRVPFEGPLVRVLHEIVYDAPQPPSRHRPKLDPNLEAIVLKAMARRPEQRYPNVQVLISDLDRWSAGLKPTARRRSKLPWLVAAGLLPVFVFIAAQVVIRIKSKDGQEIEIKVGAAAPQEAAQVPAAPESTNSPAHQVSDKARAGVQAITIRCPFDSRNDVLADATHVDLISVSPRSGHDEPTVVRLSQHENLGIIRVDKISWPNNPPQIADVVLEVTPRQAEELGAFIETGGILRFLPHLDATGGRAFCIEVLLGEFDPSVRKRARVDVFTSKRSDLKAAPSKAAPLNKLFRGLVVAAVNEHTVPAEVHGAVHRWVTLEVTPAQAEQLALIETKGDLAMTLAPSEYYPIGDRGPPMLEKSMRSVEIPASAFDFKGPLGNATNVDVVAVMRSPSKQETVSITYVNRRVLGIFREHFAQGVRNPTTGERKVIVEVTPSQADVLAARVVAGDRVWLLPHVGKDRRAMTVTVWGDRAAVSRLGKVFRALVATRIDVVSIDRTWPEPTTKTLAQNIKVLAVNGSPAPARENDTLSLSLVLEISPEEAAKIALAEAQRELGFSSPRP